MKLRPLKPLDADGQAMVVENLGLAYSAAKRAWQLLSKNAKSHIDLEELKAQALHGLVVAVSRYNPERETQFSTFAYPYCYGYAINGIREEKSVRLASSSTIDAVRSPGPEANEVVEQKETLDHLRAVITHLAQTGELTRNRWEALLLTLQGHTVAEIAEMNQVTIRAVRLRLSQAVRIIRPYLDIHHDLICDNEW